MAATAAVGRSTSGRGGQGGDTHSNDHRAAVPPLHAPDARPRTECVSRVLRRRTGVVHVAHGGPPLPRAVGRPRVVRIPML